MLARLHDAFHSPSSVVYRRVERAVGLLIVLSVALLVVELSMGVLVRPRWLDLADDVVLGIFSAEVALRIATWQPPALDFYHLTPFGRLRVHVLGRMRFCLRPMILIDLVTVSSALPALRGLRAIRLLRLLRSNRILRYANPFEGIARAFEENGLLFGFGLAVFGGAVLIGGLTFFMSERTHNDEHARTAGADEVIETTRMGFSVLAHAVQMPGTATLVGELADVRGNSLFVGSIPDRFDEHRTFAALAHALKRQHGILVIGLRSPDGSDALNPDDEAPIGPGVSVIYIAHHPILPILPR